MLMGTSSHVGKSVLTTALCRIFHQDGRKVTPFKAQNMALNSYVTKDGGEMGRSQVAQAEAAGLEPNVDMNPVLLKPTGNASSQVIINGKPLSNMSAREYHKSYSLKAFDAVKAALARLQAQYDTLVIEGAGSPAEVNLKDHDIVNMRVAKYLNAPVLLVADIDRGGALAALVGTLELLDDDERALVKGLIINRFRGDVSLFTPAIDFLEEKTGKKVLGVVPYIEKLGIEEEDSVSLEEPAKEVKDAPLKIVVIELPKLSNFTDFDALAAEPDVTLSYAKTPYDLAGADMLILPGSKNTTEDLLYLRQSGMAAAIREQVAKKVPLWGICGGYQMLGEKISDPLHTESAHDSVQGLGYLPMTTTFAAEKLTTQVTADCPKLTFAGANLQAEAMPGYEIHMGKTVFTQKILHPFHITAKAEAAADAWDGAVLPANAEHGEIVGTYIHGIFDHDGFRRELLNALRAKKGLKALPIQHNRQADKERAYNHLAAVVRQSLDMQALYDMVEASGS